MKRHQIPLLLCSAIAIVVSSRVPALSPCAFVMFIPALVALEGRPVRAWIGGSTLLWYLVALGAYYWVFHVTHRFGELSAPLAILAVLAFGLLNIWQGLAGFGLFRWLSKRLPLPRAVLFALSVTVCWHAIPALFFWDFALIIRPWRFLLQGIDLAGTFGIDLLITFTNYAVYEAWRMRRLTIALRVALALLIALLGYGALRTRFLTRTLAAAPQLRVALLQPNLDSGKKQETRFIHQSLQQLSLLSDAAMARGAELLVWPESVFPLDYDQDRRLQQLLTERIATWRVPLLFGGNQFTRRAHGGWTSFNAAFLVQPEQTRAQTYQKHVLLAFGEYLPFEDTFPILRDWFPERVGAYGRGPGPQTFRTRHFALAPVICYESIVGDYIRRVATPDAQFIVEITNDGWYGQTAALDYHKDLTVLRAVENRIGIARDTNTGITTFIDPLGREPPPLPLEQQDLLLADVPLARPFSPYRAGGYLLKPVTTVGLLFLIGWATIRRKR